MSTIVDVCRLAWLPTWLPAVSPVRRLSDGSRRACCGRTLQHLAPYFAELLSESSPGDARVLGKPVDFVTFDGADQKEVQGIVFVEVKTGRGRLCDVQRQVRAAVDAGNVEFRTIKFAGIDPDRDDGIESRPEAFPEGDSPV